MSTSVFGTGLNTTAWGRAQVSQEPKWGDPLGSAREDCQRYLNSLPNFDASCEFGGDGDVVLKFDDGSSLRCHQLLLEKWSPVLKEAVRLEPGRPTAYKQVKMHQSQRRPWRVILSGMYPVGLQLSRLGQEIVREVAIEADKYAITLIKRNSEDCLTAIANITLKTAMEWAEFCCQYNLDALLLKCIPHIKFMLMNGAPRELSSVEGSLSRFPGRVLVKLLMEVSQDAQRLHLEARLRTLQTLDGMDPNSSDDYEGDDDYDYDLLKDKYDTAMTAIENAGCFISRRGNLCSIETKQIIHC